MPDETFQSYKSSSTTQEVTTLTENALGKKVTDISRKDLGQINAVYFATLADQTECVVRISPKERNWNNFAEEAWAFDKARAVGVPTPEVLICNTQPADFPESYMITKKLPGTNGEEAHLTEEQKHTVLRQLGHYLSLIHSIKIDGFGRLQKQEETFVGTYTTLWESVMSEFESGWWLPIIRKNKLLPEEKILEIKERFMEARQLFIDQKVSSLIYTDVGLKNTLVEGNKVTGVLDMENVTASDPVQDFALFHFWIGDANGYMQSLQEGYDSKDLFDKNFRKKLLLFELLKSLSTLAFRFQKNNPDEIQLVYRRIPEIEKELENM